MTGSAARPLGPEALATALDDLPDGIAIFDADWAIRYVNPAGATLLDRKPADLLDQSIWVALPELGGTIFHSFLLHARGVGGRVTWAGFYPPVGRWLTATAVSTEDRLELYFREVGVAPGEGGARSDGREEQPTTDETVDRDRLRFLAEVSEGMISTLVTGESAAKLAQLVVPRLCDWAVVLLTGEDGEPGEEAYAHRDPARLADLATYLNGRLTGIGQNSVLTEAVLTGEPVQIRDLDPAMVEPSLPTDEVREAWRRLDVRSCTFVPLRARSETFGALGLMNCGNRPPLTEMEIAVAVETVRRGALALDNARLYGRQLKVAETLQHSLLTPPPQPDGLTIAVRYRPAAVNMHVGGDWYDAFQQPDGATLLVIGDVVGHNVDAAASMGQIRSILRGIAYDRPESPARILGRVDRVLSGLRIGSMATALVARVEQQPGTGSGRTVRWSSAGHLPPLVLRADGTVEALSTPPERLLGADSQRPRTDHECALEPGDTVVFYTDGIVEHERSGIDEGIDRLIEALADCAGLSADAVCDQLLGRIVHGRTDDDIAILAIGCADPAGDQGGPRGA